MDIWVLKCGYGLVKWAKWIMMDKIGLKWINGFVIWTRMVYGYLVRRLTFMGLSRLGYALWTPEPPWPTCYNTNLNSHELSGTTIGPFPA